jgi:PhnB protein
VIKANTYLLFSGNCKEAFNHYAKLFGGKIDFIMTHGESPMADHAKPNWKDKVMHASMTLGNQQLMGTDEPPEQHKKPQGFSVSINVDSAKDAERIFKGLEEGGTVTLPLQQTFWAERFGMLVDRFGIPWMVNFEKAK